MPMQLKDITSANPQFRHDLFPRHPLQVSQLNHLPPPTGRHGSRDPQRLLLDLPELPPPGVDLLTLQVDQLVHVGFYPAVPICAPVIDSRKARCGPASLIQVIIHKAALGGNAVAQSGNLHKVVFCSDRRSPLPARLRVAPVMKSTASAFRHDFAFVAYIPIFAVRTGGARELRTIFHRCLVPLQEGAEGSFLIRCQKRELSFRIICKYGGVCFAVLAIIDGDAHRAHHGHLAALGKVLVAQLAQLPPRRHAEEVRRLLLTVFLGPVYGYGEGAYADAGLGGAHLGVLGDVADDDQMVDRSFLLLQISLGQPIHFPNLHGQRHGLQVQVIRQPAPRRVMLPIVMLPAEGIHIRHYPYISFKLLAMKISIPGWVCTDINDASINNKQLNIIMEIEETDKVVIIQTSIEILSQVYWEYPGYESYYIQYKHPRMLICFVRFQNKEVKEFLNDPALLNPNISQAIKRGDIQYSTPSTEKINMNEIKYHIYPNYREEKFYIERLEDVSIKDKKRLKAHLFVGKIDDRSELLAIIEKAVGWIREQKNVALPSTETKHGDMLADSVYLNVYRFETRKDKNLYISNENFVCMVDFNYDGITTIEHGGVPEILWKQYHHDNIGNYQIAWREGKYCMDSSK